MEAQLAKESKELTPWEVLSKIDCSEHTEEKNGLTYLSWAWAWGMLKEHYPMASMTKRWYAYDAVGDHEVKSRPYALDENGFAYVSVSVSVPFADDRVASHTEILPVIDYRNKPIPKPDSMQVNTALQRCLAKAIAGLGLGHYIYAGEDLPQAADEDPVPAKKPKAKPKPAAKKQDTGAAEEFEICAMDPEFQSWFKALPSEPSVDAKRAACKSAGFVYEDLAKGESITKQQWEILKVELPKEMEKEHAG